MNNYECVKVLNTVSWTWRQKKHLKNTYALTKRKKKYKIIEMLYVDYTLEVILKFFAEVFKLKFPNSTSWTNFSS